MGGEHDDDAVDDPPRSVHGTWRASRRARIWKTAALLTTVMAVVVVAIVVSGRKSASKAPEIGISEAEAISNVVGIMQSRTALGSPGARVTLQYFGDLESRNCRVFTLGALPAIIQRWVRTGVVRIEYRAFDSAARDHQERGDQQIAALAAGLQNRLWDFVEVSYHDQGDKGPYVTEAFIEGLAKQIPGLDLARWRLARADRVLSHDVAVDAAAARNAGFKTAPAFLIGKTGGRMRKLHYRSLTEPTSFDIAIERLLEHGR